MPLVFVVLMDSPTVALSVVNSGIIKRNGIPDSN